MGRASSGGTCPLCGKYASFTVTGKLYRHKGKVRVMVGRGFRECRASGVMPDVARRMRVNWGAGRHAYRNEDGSWIYVCLRCGREAKPWPLEGGNKCSPARWAHCIRPPLQMPTKEARNTE